MDMGQGLRTLAAGAVVPGAHRMGQATATISCPKGSHRAAGTAGFTIS
jgi:hypothetical protein